jgi:hypothetical protein
MRNRPRIAVVVALGATLCLVLGAAAPEPLAAPAPLTVRGVRLLSGDVEPLLVGVLGQLTLDGEPIPGTMFSLFSHDKQPEDLRFFFDPELLQTLRAEHALIIRRAAGEETLAEAGLNEDDIGVIANGVELVFIRGSRSIAVIQLGPGELRLGEAITLLKTGIVKPLPELLGPKNPGEAAVAFF